MFVLCLAAMAHAADMQHQLVWDLAVQGQKVGTRTLTIKYAKADVGFERTIESYTEVAGSVGPVRVNWRQRMTAHAAGRDPASFTSTVDQNGRAMEIQGRWT